MRKTMFYLILVFLLSSCSKDIYISYQASSKDTGKIVIVPNTPTDKTSVTLNDNLIVRNKNVKSITIENVPIGENKIKYVSANHWYKDKLDQDINVNVESGRQQTKLIEVPPYSTGYWIATIGSDIALLAILLIAL